MNGCTIKFFIFVFQNTVILSHFFFYFMAHFDSQFQRLFCVLYFRVVLFKWLFSWKHRNRFSTKIINNCQHWNIWIIMHVFNMWVLCLFFLFVFLPHVKCYCLWSMNRARCACIWYHENLDRNSDGTRHIIILLSYALHLDEWLNI